MIELSTTAGKPIGECPTCGSLKFENIIHHCGTVLRPADGSGRVLGHIPLGAVTIEPVNIDGSATPQRFGCARCGAMEHSAVECTMGRFVEFKVLGEAKPAGSKKGFYNKKIGRVIITDDSKGSRPWKAMVSDAALQAMGTAAPLNGALRCSLDFYERRPKSHFNTKNELNATGRRRPYPTKKPDVDKLVRGAFDAMSTIVYVDDVQVVMVTAAKFYGGWDGVSVRVQELVRA